MAATQKVRAYVFGEPVQPEVATVKKLLDTEFFFRYCRSHACWTALTNSR